MRTTFLLLFFIGLNGIIGCATWDRIQTKLDHRDPQESASVPTEQTLNQQNRKMMEQLQEEYVKLREQVQKMEEELVEAETIRKEQQEQIRLMASQWETNFTLLERSVSNTLQQTQQQMSSLEVKSQKQTAMLQEQKQPTASQPSAPPPLIETTHMSAANKKKSTPQAAPVEAPTVVSPLLPLALPSEEHIIDDTKMSKNLAIAGKKEVKPLSDPDLEEPKNPIVLKRYPEAKKLYNQGMASIIQQDYVQAIQLFQSFTQQFPDDMDSDNSYFWIGHAYYKLNQLEQAEAAFRQVLKLYEHRPTSQGYKTPDAIYMLGIIAKQQQVLEKADYYFKQVLKRFPDSAASKSAEKELNF